MNIELAKTKHIRTLDRDFLLEKIALLITWLHQRSKLSMSDLEFDVNELCRELKQNYSDLTLVEVRIALSEGTKSEYNALNVTNYVKWLDAYKEKKIANAKNVKTYEEKKVIEPSDEEKEKAFQDNLNFCIENYKKHKVVSDQGNVIYNRLVKDNVINFPEQIIQSVREYAKAVESTRLNTAINKTANYNEVRILKQELKQLMEGKTSIESEVKRLLLERYLKTIV
jgi:hypothetical protein